MTLSRASFMVPTQTWHYTDHCLFKRDLLSTQSNRVSVPSLLQRQVDFARRSEHPPTHRTSTWRSFATISSGLYRFLAITVLLDVKDIPQVGPLQWGWISPFNQFNILAPLRVTIVQTSLAICAGSPSPSSTPAGEMPLPGSQGHKAHVCFIAPGVKPRLSSPFARL